MAASRTVIVTGGASGIGLSIAEQFLAAQALVHICDINRTAVEQAVASHPGLSGTQADVGAPAEVERVVAEAIARFGGSVDVLVNNVGIGGPHKHVEEISYEEWDASMRINVSGMFHCIKNVVPAMKARRQGVIINISTGSVHTKPTRRSDYITSKFAAEGLASSLAKELGPFGIRCNVIRPGMMDNPRMRGICEKYAAEQGRTAEDVEQDYLRFISMRSKIQQYEIGDACVFLASDKARHITGQVISVCGNIEWEG